MKYIHINELDIPYKTTKKNNKNTYFYFKKEGYIQINLSRYQREKDALKYIRKHADSFTKKYRSIQQKQQRSSQYSLWGHPFETIVSAHNTFDISKENHVITYNPDCIDHIDRIKRFEKHEMHSMIEQLHAKYHEQSSINLDNITYSTNYTSSRHGSCNPQKRHIRISTHLVRLNPIYTEYVFCHEIAHLKVSNHSQAFYNVLQELLPNYKEIRKQLKEVW